MIILCERSELGGYKFNLKKKYTHTPVYGIKEFVCLSVANFDLNYLRNINKNSQIHKKILLNELYSISIQDSAC